MKLIAQIMSLALVVFLTGCGGGSESAKEPDPTPTPTPTKMIEPGGYILSENFSRNVELSIVSNNKNHIIQEAVFIVKDNNGQERRLYAIFPHFAINQDINLGEYQQQDPYLPGLTYHASINIEPLSETNQIKITFTQVDEEFKDFGFEESQTLHFKKISKNIELSELDKLNFRSDDSKYELLVDDNEDGTASIQGYQSELSCVIEGSLQSVQDGDVRSYYIDSIAYTGCRDKVNDGVFFASMYSYVTEEQVKVKLLFNPPNIQDIHRKGGVAIELTAY